MADTERPLHITWDDIRALDAKKRRKKVRLRVAVVSVLILMVLAIGSVGVLMKNMRNMEAQQAPVENRQASASDVSARRTSKSKELSVCDLVKRWSATTMLRLGVRTQARCAE